MSNKNQIKKIISLLEDAIEVPVTEIVNGKKRIHLTGEFITQELEPNHGDYAFGVYGDHDDKFAYHVQITAVDMTEQI